ncbi:uncharacterized protein LOC117650652 isoform X2 [Thrips palmi]|uniref:Uncharacterized protein LOC117650652 isoform X2 n=1 Tax=Thrips palmi TaxID=161013 RepID=A0A6P8ZXH4_THRPL|nr:uncharacterized protein LOC117650652 isoform X2 [Thrips palmi]
MASPNAYLGNKPQLSYDTSVQRRSLHTLGKIKAKTQLFRKAGPAFRGFQYEDCYRLNHLQLVSLIQTHEHEEKQLEKDLLTIHGLSCARCTLPFSFKDHLKIHSYFCGNPNIVAGDLKALKKHHDSLQEQGGMLFCPWCPRLCLNMVALVKHVRQCREARRERDERRVLKRLPCPECCSEFSHLQKLSNHMQTHYIADFTCSGCKLSFTAAKYLAVHLISCEESIPPFRCSECHSTFSHSKALRTHILSCRTSVQCLKCAKFFPGKSLCLEHVVTHILSEWSKVGLQMIDGVLYSIMHHKQLPENISEPPLPSVSPCSSPEPVEYQERPVKPTNLVADSRSRSPLEQKSRLNSDKAPSSLDKLVKLLHGVKENKLPEISSNTKSVSILTRKQSLQSNLEDSDNTENYDCISKPDISLKSIDALVTRPDSTPEGMLSGDEDNLSVIENEVFEIEHTLDEDELLIEQEMCDSEPTMPTFETCESLRNPVKTTFEMQQEHSDVAQFFTPATDVESEDSNKLTLTVVNVEGGANLFNWDDCNFEENNCDVTEAAESLLELHGSISAPPAQTGSDVLLGADSHSDGNEDGDSGIGATDDYDNDSNKDRSEALDKCEDVISNSEMLPKLSVVPEKAGEAPCQLASSEVFVSSSSCDTEIVIESSPTIQTENTEFSLVIPRKYSVLEEHSYALPLDWAMTPDASQGTERAKGATGAGKKCRNALTVGVVENQEGNIKSRKQKKQRVGSSGKSIKKAPKGLGQNVDEEFQPPAASDTEQDPLQKILEVMSKEARQTLTKKSKPLKHPSCRKTIPAKHPHSFNSINIAAKEQSSAKINVDTSQKNVVPIYEDRIASDHFVPHPHLMDNTASQSSLILNGSVQATPPSDEHSMVREETELQPPSECTSQDISNRPPSVCTSQDIIFDRPPSECSTQDTILHRPPSQLMTQVIVPDRPPSECSIQDIILERPSSESMTQVIVPDRLPSECTSQDIIFDRPSSECTSQDIIFDRPSSECTSQDIIFDTPSSECTSQDIIFERPSSEFMTQVITPSRPPSESTTQERPSRDDFIERAQPPMSINKMLRKERSMLKHGFRQIATVLPQRKEFQESKKVSIRNNSKAAEMSIPYEKPFTPAQIPEFAALNQVLPDRMVEAVSAANTVRPITNVIYIQLPPGASAVPPLVTSVASRIPNSILARLRPTAQTTSTQNKYLLNESSTQSPFQIQQQPSEVVSTLQKPDSDVTRQSISALSDVQLAPNSSTAAQPVLSSPGIVFAGAKGMVPLLKENAVSEIVGRPVFAKISPTNCSLAVPADVPGTSLAGSYLNLPSSEETLCSKENLPPIPEASNLPTNEFDSKHKMECAMFQKSKQFESTNLNQDLFGNLNRSDSENNVSLTKSSSAFANLVDVSAISLAESTLNSHAAEETLCSKENLPPIQESSQLPIDEHEKQVNTESMMPQEETLCSMENLPPVQESSHLPVNEHTREENTESMIFQKSTQLESNTSEHDVSDNGGSTNVKGDVPLVEAAVTSHLLNVKSSSNVPTLSSEEAVCTKENPSLVEESSNLPPNKHDNELEKENTILQKSQQLEINHPNRDENTAVKAVEESSCNFVNEEVKQLKRNNDLETDLFETPVAPSPFSEDGFEEDVCNDTALDHEIKALISCLDSNIAVEETRGPEDLTVNSEQSASIEVPLAENLQTHVSESRVVDRIKMQDVPNKTDPKLTLTQAKPFEVCSMQLCKSTNEDEFSLNSFTTVENPTEDIILARNENTSVSVKSKRSTISHFRTNLYAFRKLMTEMKYFKRHRYGREGLYQRNDVGRFNCDNCSQWFYSQTILEEHTCLKAVIREKFTSEEFDRLIDANPQQIECAQDLVQVNDKSGQSQLTPNSTETYVSPYLSYLQMKATIKRKKLICEKCKIRCKSFSALLEHKSKAHDEKYSVECHICGKKFARLQQLAVHVAKSHKDKSNPSMDTPIQPGKGHVLKSSLFRKAAVLLAKRHKAQRGSSIKTALQMTEKPPSKNLAGTEHTDESPTAQSSPSKESDDLNTALKETPSVTDSSNPESRDINSQCSICSKFFKGKAGLTSHMVQAHRENPTPCNDDDVTKCSICNKLFKGKGGLTSHMNQAHRETFKCPLCLRRFCYVQTLKFHLSKHHSSSLNTDAFVLESMEPANNVEFSPSKLVSPEDVNTSTVKDVLASTAETSLETPDAKDDASKSPCDSVLPKEENLQKTKKTKWKFVRDTSFEETSSPEQPTKSTSGSLDAENHACNLQTGNASPKKSEIRKPKKVKWRIVKDNSPEKLSSPERPAKSPRLTENCQASVPPLVISFSKVKKHRHKCSICKKHFKKRQHLVQHQIGAHKFRPELQLQSHIEQSNNKSNSASSAEDQDSYAPVVSPNSPVNDVTIVEKNMCAAEKNVFEFGNPGNGQSTCEDIESATMETNASLVDSTAAGRGENSNEEQTNCINPADVLTSDPGPSIPSETSMEEPVASPPQPNPDSVKLKCDMCQIDFSAKGYLERHNIKVHGATCKFKCTLCDKIFVDIRSLRFHKKLKHKNVEEDGGKNTKLPSHFKLKTSEESKCELCTKTFTRKSDLRRHKRTIHDHFECRSCPLYFKSDELLAAHNLETHSEGSEGKTPESLTSPKESNAVNQDMVNSEGMAEVKRKSNDLEEELETHKCKDCSLTYKTVSCLKRHRILMHAEEASHNCDVCGKGFSYPHTLKNHVMTHFRNEPKWKSMASEGKTLDFSTSPKESNDVNQEIVNPEGMTHSKNEPQWKSTGSEGETVDSLISPKESNDDNPEMVNSEGTPEVERNSDDLEEELEILKCKDCSLTYRTVSCLKRHRILMHAEQASHTCDVCGKGFSYPHSLKNHLMTHSWSEPTRKSRRAVKRKYPREDFVDPGSSCDESEPSCDRSTPAGLEKESDVPVIPVSETITENDMSDCHTSDKGLEENLAKSEVASKEPQEEHGRSTATPSDEDLQHHPAPVENISSHENDSYSFTDSSASVNYNCGSTSVCSTPMENYSFTNSYLKGDVAPVPYEAGQQSADVTDSQWRPAPQTPQYQMPPMLSLPAPSIHPVPEPPVNSSFDQVHALNTCPLCGLCLPSWYALQEHYYVFHSYPNYGAAAPPAPLPYAAPLNYPAFPSQNATYSGWTQQHQITTIASSGVVNDGAASFQELSSQSGAHCSVCGLVFPSLFALQEHYATHMAAPKPALQYSGGFY